MNNCKIQGYLPNWNLSPCPGLLAILFSWMPASSNINLASIVWHPAYSHLSPNWINREFNLILVTLSRTPRTLEVLWMVLNLLAPTENIWDLMQDNAKFFTRHPYWKKAECNQTEGIGDNTMHIWDPLIFLDFFDIFQAMWQNVTILSQVVTIVWHFVTGTWHFITCL